MKILGLITEYNPFHNGHLYHLKKSKEVTGATHTIAVMSGNFLQRGEPALLHKWARAEMAVEAGVDLVIELPAIYACAPAEFFAFGAVRLLDSLGIINCLCFGSEHGSMPFLEFVAEAFIDMPTLLQSRLKHYLGKGFTFPAARANALSDYLENKPYPAEWKLDRINKTVHSPNNILAVEYIKALKQLKSSIVPHTVKRVAAPYHSKNLAFPIASASAVREHLQKNGSLQDIKKNLPISSYNILEKCFKEKTAPIFYSHFDQIILSLLRREHTKTLADIFDVSEGLENRITRCGTKSSSLNELYHCIKSKRYTLTRIQRICMHLLLNIQKKDYLEFNNIGGPQYIRILAFNNKGRELLKLCKTASSLPIITKLAQFKTDNPAAQKMLSIDIRATNIYSLVMKNKEFASMQADYFLGPYYLYKPQ